MTILYHENISREKNLISPNVLLFCVLCRTVEGLEEWRKEAKEMQRQQEMKVIIEGRLKYPKAADTAPFATDGETQRETNQQLPSSAEMRLKVKKNLSVLRS